MTFAYLDRVNISVDQNCKKILSVFELPGDSELP